MKIQHEGEQAGGTGMMMRFGRAMRGPAAVLRAVAGVPAGVARTRRGTFMVVVIGTLALLAVIAIAHFAVSQSDRRASASLARASKVDEVPDQIAEHLKGVIIRDRFVNVPEEVSDLLGSSDPDRQRFIARRESVDRPSTDWRTLSTDNRLTIDSNGLKMPNRQYFTPEGVGTDPWLADIAPQWLNWTGQDPAVRNQEEYRYRRDWGKISNFSPDGRFVSLVNIRNNFAAESGFGNDASGKPRTSEGLSLLTWNPANVGQRATRILATDFGLPAGPGTVASRRPAVWDSRQRGAYRAAKEWSSLLPSDIGYLDNEWVDTDGDGFVDARWAELVDARFLVDQFGNGIMKNALVTDGKLRWFYAARAIDLSGLINVNTATDLRHEPGMAYPIGLTPADIDLKRLLTLSDAYEQWGVGYDSILQPIGAQNSSKASNYREYTKANAFDMGLGAYNSIRWSIDSVLVQDRYANSAWNWSGAGYNGKEGGLRHASWRAGASSTTGASFAGGQVTLPAFFPNTDMGELLGRFGVNNPDETSRLEAATDGRVPNAGGGGIPRRQFAYGPLRSNRDEAIEGNRTGSVNPAGVLTDRGQATDEAMLQSVVDLRSQLTTISASNEIPSMVGNDQTNYAYSSWATQIIANKDTKVQLAKFAAAGTKPASGDLFNAYVRALAPAIKLPKVWPTGGVLPNGSPEFRARKTLFYGHRGPETALVVAGAMAVNAETMFSNDGTINEPRTLVFDSEIARLASERPQAVPKNSFGLPMVPWLRGNTSYCLDPSDNGNERVLADDPAKNLQTPALHLNGFEPQVFITEVGCYTAWRDTPFANGGDNDRRPVILGQPNGFITIDGDLDENNADFMFRCVAIQLHNPFDEDVVVSTGFPVPAGARIDGAREFSYVKIKQHDQSGSDWANVGLFTTQFVAGDQISVSGLTVAAGETVVCYVFNKNPISVARRLADQGVVVDAEAGKAFLRDWAEKQFSESGSIESVSKRAVMVVGIDERISSVITDAAANSKMIEDPTGALGMTVQLWKSRRANMSEYGEADEVGAGPNANNANLPWNDQMVDRFRLPPNTVTLDARIKSGNNDVDGCFGGNPAGPFGPLNHNSGITIARWTTASRPSDPMDGGAAGTDIPRGGLPAYCIEPKVWRPPGGGTWHTEFHDPTGPTPDQPLTVTKAVIDQMLADNKKEAEFTASAWASNGRSTAYSGTITKSPRNKRTAPSAVLEIPRNLDGVDYKLVRDLMPRSARGDKGFGGVNPTFGTELPGTPSKASTLRVADMLLPMAICPWESPMRPDASFSEQTDLNIRFLTAAEAFAVAYGYEIIPAPSADPTKADPLSLYFKAPDGTNPDGNFGNRERPVMVNGHVVLDDFVPFYDGNLDGLFNRDNAYNGIVGGASPERKDIRFGLGIPAALGVMDQFSAFGDYEGSPIRPVSGLININTAPANVLRMLPLVTPADTAWGRDLIWSNGWSQTDVKTDLAASIVAYRDKLNTYLLPSRVTGVLPVPARFTGDQAAGRPHIGAAGGNATEGTERQIGRALASQIDAIREETGFLSTGELMCVLERRANDQGGSGTQREKKKSLDSLGFNNQTRTFGGANNDRKGINSQLFKGTGGTLDVDEVKNDFAERLQVMAALSNVTTVRSDVFAVWFVVRGYAQEDTENLGPDDPMTPSVERRFVMVIDRSGVSDLRGANQARVVLFKEVPR